MSSNTQFTGFDFDIGAMFDEAAAMDDVTKKHRNPATEESVISSLLAIKEEANLTMTDEYERAFRLIFQDLRNVFLTGGAGVGKTTFQKEVVIRELNARGIKFAVTATTGIAGSHLDGRTIHSWSGVGLGPLFPPGISPLTLSRTDIDEIYAKTYKAWSEDPRKKKMIDGVKKRIRSTEVLIIDEVSMCAGVALLDYLDFFFRSVREDGRPFGGLQMIFTGDACQLPPVEKIAGPRVDWCFLSRSWASAEVETVEFTHVFRQADLAFATFLNNRRAGVAMSPEEQIYAQQFVRALAPDEAVKSTFLSPTNAQADHINSNVLRYYPEPEWTLPMQFVIQPHHETDWDDMVKIRKKLIRGTILKEELRLRKGLPVLLTFNDPDGRFVNGSRAFVVEYKPGVEGLTDDLLIVELAPGSKSLPGDPKAKLELGRVSKCVYAHESPEETYIMVDGVSTLAPLRPYLKQFPVIPATAITVHRCVDKSTLVPTITGVKEIGNICDSCGDVLVAGIDGYKSACEPFIGGREMGYRIVTRRGYSLLCSERHPLLRIANDGETWTKAPELVVGDKLRMRGNTLSFGDGSLPSYCPEKDDYQTSKAYRLPAAMSVDLAWLLGALTGDGCGTDRRDGRFDVTTIDAEIVSEFVRVVGNLFGIAATAAPKYRRDVWSVYAHNWGVRRFLLWLGFTHDKAPTKRVPKAVWGGTREHHVAFLRGYFDTDGGVNSAVHVTSSSRELLGDVHMMLLNLGIVSTIAFMPKDNPAWHDNWRINITGADAVKYRELVGFTVAHKKKACDNLPANRRVIPKSQCGEYPRAYGKRIAEALRDELRAVYPAIKADALGFGEHQAWAGLLSRVVSDKTKTALTDEHLRAMLRVLPRCIDAGPVSSKVFAEAAAGCFNDEIVSITREEGDMRDIAVPDGHAFVGNGFVNHNSQGMTLDECVVDLRRAFAPGQAYVAMSRLRTPEGLKLITTDFDSMVDPDVMRFYRALRVKQAYEKLDLPTPQPYIHDDEC